MIEANLMAKRFLVILAGGTIVMRKKDDVHVMDDDGEKIVHGYIQELGAHLQGAVTIDTQILFNKDSTDVGPDDWGKMTAAVIQGIAEGYSGFLITMGTNTLAYAASALSFSLMGIQAPIIITGAQIPPSEITSDARNNVIHSLRILASEQLKGVFVVFGSRIILGCRAKKTSERKLDAFVSYNSEDYGSIGVNTKITGRMSQLVLFDGKNTRGFERNVSCITLTPGMQEDILHLLIDGGAKGIIIRAYGSGDIPTSLLDGLKYAKANNVPVLVTTQCPDGATMIGINPPGAEALKLGVIPANDMCMEAMTTKLMWLLDQKLDPDAIGRWMQTNIAGELSYSNRHPDITS